MNCSNCGAATKFSRSLNRFRCTYCASEFRPSGPAAAFVDGLEPTNAVTDWPCPLCAQSLAGALLDGREVSFCHSCEGLLVPRSDFVDIVRMRRAGAERVDDAAPFDPHELHRSIACPRCARKMETHPFYGPGNVVIDSCSACGLLWLDAGELKIIETSPGRR